MTLLVGLTGGIGSGKSAASAIFERLGITVVDADVVAREVVQPGEPALNEIARHFGNAILLPDGQLNRAKLREHIFKDQSAKLWLESLLHPLIRDRIITALREASSPYAILVSPLLFETNQHELVSTSILVDVPVELQIKRATARDDSSNEQIESIIASQMPREEKLKRADIVLDNSHDLTALQSQIETLHNSLLHELA